MTQLEIEKEYLHFLVAKLKRNLENENKIAHRNGASIEQKRFSNYQLAYMLKEIKNTLDKIKQLE